MFKKNIKQKKNDIIVITISVIVRTFTADLNTIIMKRTLLITILCLMAACMQAARPASPWLRHVAAYNDTVFGIKMSLPAGYMAGNEWATRISYAPNIAWGAEPSATHNAYLYSNTAISRDGECMLMYPYLVFVANTGTASPGKSFTDCLAQYNAEMSEAVRNLPGSAFTADATTGVTRMGGAEAAAWGNADSVYIADIPVSSPCLKRFTHCVAVYMAKSGQAPVFLKLLMTDNGYADRTRALDSIKGCMTYATTAKTDSNDIALSTNKMLNIDRSPILTLKHGEPVR